MPLTCVGQEKVIQYAADFSRDNPVNMDLVYESFRKNFTFPFIMLLTGNGGHGDHCKTVDLTRGTRGGQF